MRKSFFVKILAQVMLAGELEETSVLTRVTDLLGRRWGWLPRLSRRYVGVFESGTRPRQRDVVRFLSRDEGLKRAWEKHSKKLSIVHWLTQPHEMRPVPAARNWGLPALESSGVLADWFGLSASELEWFADRKGLACKQRSAQIRHYHYKILTKQSGSLRLIEAPKSRLKQMQRKILTEILNKVPAHDSVHGFVQGRSIKTFVSPHVGQSVVLRIDLRDFFPSFPAARIEAVFRTLGYPESIADFLAGICTCATPRDVWSRSAFGEDPLHLWESRGEAQALYARRHLPQGSPTSPALANICTYRLDCRLAGLAKSVGSRYTRYADDLAFSGDLGFQKTVNRFAIHVAAIVQEEGFRVHHRKTRIMRQGVRQHLAGLVANQRANIRRVDYDRLKATLTNCVRLGPHTQNRDSHPLFREHLEGRVGFVEMINPGKGRRLRSILERIAWE